MKADLELFMQRREVGHLSARSRQVNVHDTLEKMQQVFCNYGLGIHFEDK